MIRFLFGDHTDEKNAALLRYIEENVNAGEKAILLVPEQETVTVERRVVEALPATAQLLVEVSNFTRLANRIFRTVGGFPTVTPPLPQQPLSCGKRCVPSPRS